MTGAGKGAVVDYLKQKGFAHFSARELIHRFTKERGWPLTREMTTKTADDLRRTKSPSFIAEELYKEAEENFTKTGQNAVLESIRALAEIDFLRTKPNFILFGVNADPKIRYERTQKRKSELDQVTFEEFLANEAKEDTDADPTRGNLSGALAQADFVFMNDGSLEELHQKVDEALRGILAV